MCVYPQLSLNRRQDFGFFRAGGPGLANCLFVAARAYLRAKALGCEMLRPTWERLSVGQILRRERDKRFYHGLFKDDSLLKKLRKVWLIRFCKHIETVSGLGCFFEDILDKADDVRQWFFDAVEPSAIKEVPEDMKRSIAIHVRLGDFPESMRVSIQWYCALVTQIQNAISSKIDIQIFSDGRDDELSELLKMPGARRVYYGNALADIVAISRCGLLIAGKYSTFSAWGAYLGNVPSIFSAIDYGRVLPDSSMDLRLGESCEVPMEFLEMIKGRFK